MNSFRIKFTVVAEPPGNQPTLDCVDIGYATVNVKQLLHDEHDLIEKDIYGKRSFLLSFSYFVLFEVHGIDKEEQVIGQMNVTVSIVQALKSVQNNRQIHS